MFLRKLELSSNTDIISNELNRILEVNPWGNDNQIGLKHRVGADNHWKDAVGSLYDKNANLRLGVESDFTQWSIDQNWYVRQQIEILENTLGIKTGRIRFMNLLPRRGLSVHRDDEIRYHLVLSTNPKSFVAMATNFEIREQSDLPTTATCFHIPHDNNWYEVDTTQTHWVYNGGDSPRVHLVVCGL
jgi:hypothetical protein